MSSPVSDAFKNAVNKKIEEETKKTKNRVEVAMERTEKRVEEKIQEIIEEHALNFYYEGYAPKHYTRTFQLPKAISPITEEFTKGVYIGFNYGASFDEGAMHHVKRGKSKKKIEVDEKLILDNFRAGKHPNTGVEQGAIWKQGMTGVAPDVLRAWKNSGAIKEIFMQEFRSLI